MRTPPGRTAAESYAPATSHCISSRIFVPDRGGWHGIGDVRQQPVTLRPTAWARHPPAPGRGFAEAGIRYADFEA